MTKWIMAVAAVVVIGAGAWWYFAGPHASTSAPQEQATSTPSGPDTSDQSIAQDAVAAQMQITALTPATSTAGLPAQVAATQSAADQLANLSLKFSMRVAQVGTTSPLSTTLNASLSDLNAKIADVHTQAQAALGHLANATTQGASAATAKAENAKAVADMRVASQDFTAALKDVGALMSSLNIAPAATSSVTAPEGAAAQ